MRRLLTLALLFALAAPATAWALASAPGDGTLAVRGGKGNLTLSLTRGAVLGKMEAGLLRVRVDSETDCASLDVFGADKELDPFVRETLDGEPIVFCQFREFRSSGTLAPIRFRLVGPGQAIQIWRGVEFSLSAVGRGRGTIRGTGGLTDGTYSVNGEDYASLPDDSSPFRLGTLLP